MNDKPLNAKPPDDELPLDAPLVETAEEAAERAVAEAAERRRAEAQADLPADALADTLAESQGVASTDAAEFVWDVIVIGAGAAGMVAAERAAQRGRTTLLLEKNPHAGVKILMSGGTRCNLTHATDKRGIIRAYGEQGRFLHSALARLGPADLVKLVEDEGVKTKVEETGKIFPASDRASDIVDALQHRVERSGATLLFRQPVVRIVRDGQRFRIETTRQTFLASRIIVTTGGRSYPGCGTSGDGYNWMAELGHTVVPTRPALTPITTDVQWVRDLQGITLPDVLVRVLPCDAPVQLGAKKRKDVLAERRSSLLFTHFGLSGPAALDVSRVVSGHPQPRSLNLVLDLCPDTTVEQLDEQLRREASADGRRQVTAILPPHLPKRIGETLLTLGPITAAKAAELPKASRQRLVELLKHLPIRPSGTMGFRKAEVTAGGVSLDEVDSHTMQSRVVPGLYLAGEILDLDGPIGGFNFQAAFSTGVLAGESV